MRGMMDMALGYCNEEMFIKVSLCDQLNTKKIKNMFWGDNYCLSLRKSYWTVSLTQVRVGNLTFDGVDSQMLHMGDVDGDLGEAIG